MDACMSRGPNQHYLPKFLQKTFGVPHKRKQIWCFERDSLPVKQPIKRTASRSNFYSRPTGDGLPTLDDAITDSESDLALTLDSIRSKSVGESVDSNTAADIIQHLALRTAHVRDTMQHGLTRLFDLVVDQYGSSDNLERLLGLNAQQPTDHFRETIFRELVQRPEIVGANLSKQTLERFAFCIARESVSDIVQETRPAIRSALHRVFPQLGDVIREGHNEALTGIVKPGPRDALLLELDWTIHSAPATGVILPDFVVMAISNNGTAEPLIYASGENVCAVIIPVAPTKLLIGRKDGYTVPHDFDYNLEAARLSQTFFLSSANDAETSRVHPVIGAHVPLLVEELIGGAVQEFSVEEAVVRPRNLPDNRRLESESACETGKTFGYDIWLIECADREGTARLGETIQTIVSALSQALPLGRLDGITIARDYPAAVKALERGFDTGTQLETVPPDIGVGIAQTATIVKADRIKARILMADSVAHDLISQDPKRVDWAIYVLVNELAQVGMIDTAERAFPGTTLARPGSKLDRGLFAIFDPGLHVHAASCIAAGFGDPEKIADLLRDYLARSIDLMMSRVPNERLAYHRHRDVDRLAGVAFSAVRHVLILGAQLLGHCAGTGLSPTDDAQALTGALDRAGLTKWFNTYERDLERFRSQLGHWTSFDEFMAFNIHVERLLWHVGIVPSEDGGRLCIDVFMGADTRDFFSTNETGST